MIIMECFLFRAGTGETEKEILSSSGFFHMGLIDDKCLFLDYMTGCCHYEIDTKERLVVCPAS